MAITRRQFLKRTGLATAGSVLGPAFLRNPLLRNALATAMGDHYLVVLQADGGNDGQNTVVPLDDGDAGTLRSTYETMRLTGSGGLQLSPTVLMPTAIGNDPISNTPLALHPGFSGFKSLYDAGHLAVVQGCGYPNQNLSHATSKGFWQSADPLGVLSGNAGWVGRFLIASLYGESDIPAVNVRSAIAPEFAQTATNVLAFSRLSSFTFPYDGISSSDKAAKAAAYAALYADAAGSAEDTMRFVGNAGSATLTASQSYPPIDAVYKSDRSTFNQAYTSLNSSTANDLREVAKIIYAVENNFDPTVCARFFEVRNGGYDTHSNQGAETGAQFNLHQEVGNAVELFYSDLEDMGIADKVLIVWWSEFSRRIKQNSSGTDHGTQGPMFVIGGGVNGGVYGNHPDINSLNSQGNTIYSQAAGDPYRSTDFRDVFGTILRHWLDVTDPSTILPVDSGDPNTLWTAPSFDMGFV